MTPKQAVYELQDFKLDQYNLKLNEVLFHNANGYIGIRYNFEEGYPEKYQFTPGQYINGFYDYAQMNQAEKLYGLAEEKQTMLNIADTQRIKMVFDEEEFSMFSGTVLASRLSLDMDRGITVRNILWRSPQGKEFDITIKRMASFYQLPLFTIDYEVQSRNFSGDILIESVHDGTVLNFVDPDDPRMACEVNQYLTPSGCEIKEGASYITSHTSKSGLEVCSCVKNLLFQEHQQEYMIESNDAICRFKTTAKAGETIRIIKYAVFCDSIRYENCKDQAEKEMERALSISLEELYQKQEEYLADYWANCSVAIEGDEESNSAIRYSLYQLLQSVGKDQYSNIAPKGLSGDGYEGQFFWDSEMYIQPFFTITNPAISRHLIENRYATLDRARENAKILGHSQGALYPWRTIMGRECSGYFPAGSAQYHINGDIAYSIIAYYLATKDTAFMQAKGAEIVFETARLWIDVGNYHKGKFYINDVTGPDEYTCIVNNNYYTNVLAQYHLNWAVKLYSILETTGPFKELVRKIGLTDEEISGFSRAAENMYLPYDEELKINPQDDSFLQKEKWDINTIPPHKFPLLLHYHPLYLYRHQICKQADTVMAHFILEDAQSEETMLNSFKYYEKITTHDSSLSMCMFSIMAARLGMADKAFDYYENTARLDLEDKHKNTDDGIHVANMGGNYMAVVYGFGGFRLKAGGISFAPILPRQWTAYRFKISYEDSRILVHVKEHECIFILESGGAKNILVYNKEYSLEDTLIISRPSTSK
ncbi:MAG: glycosyl hydrolase family 65 protein [Syntrophomonadaceae bacterium]|nr:glycosyl hydrolase family 65 protein [Syntrophomonadaceae bacterium]